MKRNFEEMDLMEMFMKEAKKIPLLKKEEEFEIARKANAGDLESLNHLVLANIRFVYRVVYKHWSPGLPLMDMISEGCMGLIRAAQKHEPEKGFRFLTYAEWWITAKIFRLLKNHSKHDHKSIDKPAYDDSEMTIADTLSSENDIKPDDCSYHNQAKGWLDDLNDRDREIIILRF